MNTLTSTLHKHDPADLAALAMADLWLKKPNSLQLLLLSGLPASGKTTEAKAWVAEDPGRRIRINYDELRLELFGAGWKFNYKDESLMKFEADNRVRRWLLAGFSVVVDNTNLTPRSRNHWKKIASDCGTEVVEQEFDTPVQICKDRDAQRSGSARVGWAVIDRMALFNGFIDWSDKDLYQKSFIVVDMDGTLTDCSWRRKFIERRCVTCNKLQGKFPGADKLAEICTSDGAALTKKDWGAFFRGVGEDPPVEPILKLVKTLYSLGLDIIIVSGRPSDQCGAATEAWLRKYLLNQGVQIRHLFMRQGKDQRPDTEVKQEILDLLPKDRITYVLDDRDAVVEMWRRNGLTCLQAADGKF